MHTQTVLDFAIFQLTPTRTRCELFAAAGNETEKLASGILKPFLSHMQAVKEQLAKGGHSIRLQPPPPHPEHTSWFTKGTLERFIRFVSNPEVLERVSTIETELIQLEETVKMQTRNSSAVHAHDFRTKCSASAYSAGGKNSGRTTCGEKLVQIKNVSMDGNGDDVAGNSRKRLLQALEARHTVLQKEQGMSFARAAAAGFDNEHLMELITFSDCFGALRLRKACIQFMALCKKRQKAGLWMEDLETVARIQSDRPLITMMKPRISIKTSSGSNGGDSRVLEEVCDEPTNDSEDSLIGAGRTGTPDECFGNCTWSGKKSPIAAAVEEHLPPAASGNHRGAERFTGTLTGVPFTSAGWCGLIQKQVCHEALLEGSQQVDQKTLASFCVASCEDSNSSCLSVSKFSNSNQISQATPAEPLQIFVSDASMDCSCAKSHKSLFSQECSGALPKLLSNHDHFHTLTKMCFAHEDPNPRQQNLALPLKQIEHGHERPSDMVVVENQLFTAATSLHDPSGKDDIANGFAGNCCKDHMSAMETTADLRPLSVRDVVSIFERKCQEEPANGDGSPKQECYASENFQKVRKNILKRWNARVFVDEACHKDGTTEKRIDEGSLSEINLSYGQERRVNGMAPYEVGTSSSSKCTGLQGSLDSTVFNNSEPQKGEGVGSPYSDTSAAPLHSALHKGSNVPRRTTLRVECKMKTKENLAGTSVIRIKTDDMTLNPPGPFIIPSIEKDPACTCWDSGADNCTHSLPHPSLPNQSLDISKPSEERVKRFLDRYNEKRESKMRNLSSSKRKEREVNLEGMEKNLEKKKEGMNKNHKSEKLIVLDDPGLRAEKLRAYKAGLQKRKKDKEEEERRRLEEMKVRRRERVSSLKTSTSAAPSALPDPHCLSTQQRLNSKLSPRLQKSAAPVKSSVSGPSLKQKGATGLLSADSCKSGGSKKLRNPLTRSAPSEIQSKVERATNRHASTGSQFTPENKGVGQMRSSLHSRDKSTITATNAENRKNCQVSKGFTRKVKPPAADTKGKGVCADKNGKDFSVHSRNITEPKQAPRSFLKKGSGARSIVGGGVSKSRFVSKDTVATHHKRDDAVLSPPSKLQSVGMGLGQQAQAMPIECLPMPPQAGSKAETDSQLSSAKNGSGLFGGSIDGFELAAQQVSAEALGGKLSVSSVSPRDLSCQELQTNPTVDSNSRSADPKMSYEETRISISLTNMQPTFVAHSSTEGKYQACGSQMPSDPSSEDALSDANALFKSCAPTEPLPIVHDNNFSQTFDIFRTPAAQGTEISTASSSQSRSTNLVSSGVSDVSRTEFQQFGMKWGTSRYISFIEPHTPTNSQGKDLKRFLKFGRKSIHGHGYDHSDQVSTSIFSEGDEDRGSFSEPGSKIVDCYGRKRHSSGKTFNLRGSSNDMHHCSASSNESGGSRNLKTMMTLKRSVSTHEIRTKSQDGKNSKTSAVKATRAFFSLAPFRRKAVEVKS